MRLLLHCCCGPCSLLVAEHFRQLGEEPAGWFFNPNIHPEEERRRREATLAKAATAGGIPLLPGGPEMSFDEWLLALARCGGLPADLSAVGLPKAEALVKAGRRCPACYQIRLEAAAQEAARLGFDAFSSTLLISPYQNLEAIAEIGRAAGARAGVEFRFADLRGRYTDSRERARELELYQQNYCGCVFSALERAERRAKRALEKALTPTA